MVLHLFKLIWNRKKQNFLLMLEIFVSFLVLFAIFTLSVFYFNNYRRPAGFEYSNVWAVNYGLPQGIKSGDSVRMLMSSLKNSIVSLPEVEDMSFTAVNIPYSASSHNTSVSYNGKSLMSDIYMADREYARVLKLSMQSGSWPSAAGNSTGGGRIVLNNTIKEKLFGNERVIGKKIKIDKEDMEIAGVVNDIKSKGDYQEAGNGIYMIPDSIDHRDQNIMLIKVKQGTGAAFEARLYKLVSDFSESTSVEIEHLSKKRDAKNNLTLIPMFILLVVAAFLIINVALGLFGVLWYTINRRKAEIGLRRAIGASGNAVSRQVAGEAVMLATVSVLAGSFFALQFPLLNVFDLASNVYLAAMLLSVIFIYILVILCTVYPAKQAAAIYPALALHEE